MCLQLSPYQVLYNSYDFRYFSFLSSVESSMSNHDGAQSSQTAEHDIGQGINITNEQFLFDDESERVCSSIVENFHRGRVSKATAVRRIYLTLLKGRTDLSSADEVQVDSTCDTYFEMLEEICNSNKLNEQAGLQQASPRADTPRSGIVV
jgi:hypothetical protein